MLSSLLFCLAFAGQPSFSPELPYRTAYEVVLYDELLSTTATVVELQKDKRVLTAKVLRLTGDLDDAEKAILRSYAREEQLSLALVAVSDRADFYRTVATAGIGAAVGLAVALIVVVIAP